MDELDLFNAAMNHWGDNPETWHPRCKDCGEEMQNTGFQVTKEGLFQYFYRCPCSKDLLTLPLGNDGN